MRIDADCTFLHKNWDEILINEISVECSIIGTQALENPESKRPSDFPLLFAMLFDTKIFKSLKIDFRPNLELSKDTGFEVYEKFIKKGYKGKLIYVKNTRDYKLGPFAKLICSEYYLEGYKDVFVSHFGRGSTLGSGKYLRGWKKKVFKIPKIGYILIKLRGKRERRKWMRICKKIVETSN